MEEMMLQAHAPEAKRTHKAVYTIVKRPGEESKSFWIRIGTAFVNHDLSLNVRLDASPTNGQLHIRDAEPYDPNRVAARRALSQSQALPALPEGNPFGGLGSAS